MGKATGGERRFIFRIDDDESRRRGAVGSRRRTLVRICTHAGGAVCRHGVVDGRHDKGLFASFYMLKMAETTSGACAQGAISRVGR